MGYWGVRSYDNDLANDALDGALETIHGEAYDALMDDRNPISYQEAQDKFLDAETLAEAVEILRDELGEDMGTWDEEGRLALAGVVVRHAERQIPVPADLLALALTTLETEDLEWDDAKDREHRRRREIELLRTPAG
jgi:hypothetical protein